MHVDVNWADVAFGLILLAAGVLAAATYCFLESRRIAAEENRQRRQFEHEMTTAELPAWNGETYEWTPESLAYLDDTHLYAGPGIADTAALETVPENPVPPSSVSGPLPELNAEDGTEAFISAMRSSTDTWLARFGAQTGT